MNRKIFCSGIVFVLILVSLLAGSSVVRKINGAQKQITPRKIQENQVADPQGGRQIVLFVEDPAGLGPPSPDQYWQAVLDSVLGIGNYDWFGPTTSYTEDGPDLATMQLYSLVIWNCYDCWDPGSGTALTATDQTNIASYISGGGKVWLIGQDILYSGVPYSWMTTNFDMQSAIEDYNPAPAGNPYPVAGVGELTGYNFSFLVDWGSDVFADALTPTTNAHTVIQDVNYPSYYPSIFRNDNTTSFWTVDGRNPNPWSDWQQIVYIMLDSFGVLVGVAEEIETPTVFSLELGRVIPNPFRDGGARLSYSITKRCPVSLKIYDNAGRLVRTIINSQSEEPGEKTIYWDGKDTNHQPVTAGVYFYRLTAENKTATRKMIVVK